MSEMKKDSALKVLADYIVNSDINYVGGEFEREDTKELFMVTVSKQSALKNLTETIAQQAEEIEKLREALGYSMESLSMMTEDAIDVSDGVRNLSLDTLVDCNDILYEIKLLPKGNK